MKTNHYAAGYAVGLFGSERRAWLYWRRLASRMAHDGHPNTGAAFAICATLASKILEADLEILDVARHEDFVAQGRLQSASGVTSR